MVYYRKYRRTGKGYARRGKSGYSMYKLYKSRSSGSQARQIYGLNKKLKAIQRRTKPEIMIAPLVQGSFLSNTGGTLTNGVRIFSARLTNLSTIPGSGSTPSNTLAYTEGRFARIQNITLKGIFTYNNGDTINDQQRMLGYLRIVLVQLKVTRETSVDNDIFSTTIAGTNSSGTSAALTEYSMIRAPLKYGSARAVKFLSDKTYMISDTKQAVNIKTKLKYVRNWYKSLTDVNAKGDVFMYVMLFNQQGVSESNISDCRFDYVSKCVYTDA